MLKNFLEDEQTKPCLSLMFSKLSDDKDLDYMHASFVSLLDGYFLSSNDPGIKRLGGEYSISIKDTDKDIGLSVRREDNEIVIKMGSNYYINKKGE